MRYVLLIPALLMMLASVASASKISTPEELIREMHDRYAKSWYKTLTFVQKTTNYEKDGTSASEIWYEAASLPGKLRIDFDPLSSGNGILFADDQIFQFKDGKLEKSQPLVHPLMVLGFDVYALPAQATIDKLKGLKIDLSILREDMWQGRPVYVVGAKQGDARSRQFWVDKERLYFVRMIQPTGKDGASIQEIQFNKYERAGGGWVAPEVVFLVDGKQATLEEYTEIRADVKLDSRLFEPRQWSSATHWRAPPASKQ
ncbi:MAG: outer membrane lipoprotein-sorting protein [Pyrinomonadaceae bacterium]